jgi:hypothetical protein
MVREGELDQSERYISGTDLGRDAQIGRQSGPHASPGEHGRARLLRSDAAMA